MIQKQKQNQHQLTPISIALTHVGAWLGKSAESTSTHEGSPAQVQSSDQGRPCMREVVRAQVR
jgi:hypothetical protein